MNHTLHIDGKSVELYPSAKPGAPLVVLNTVTGEGGAVAEAVRGMTEADFALAAVGNLRWDEDMCPWPAPPVRPQEAPFAGGADGYLQLLTERILPEAVAKLPEAPAYIALAGYSLGGLFALYAVTRTDVFARVASASGSLWYPGFAEYARTHAPLRRPDCLYLSLGDQEGRTKNPMMRPVEENTRLLARHYQSAGIHAVLEMNPGGHFRDAVRRTARGIAWMLEA